MAEENSFQLLWERARGGDRDAQAELYLEFGPHLRRIIRLKLRDLNLEWAVEPDDILDSFFIRLCGGRAKISIRDALHFTNYCEQALRNKCVTVLRWIIPRLADPSDDFPIEVFGVYQDDQLANMEWSEQLAKAYAQLTHRERIVCWLVLGDHDWDEIGSRLNISAAAARKVHQRAEAHVRAALLAGGAVDERGRLRDGASRRCVDELVAGEEAVDD